MLNKTLFLTCLCLICLAACQPKQETPSMSDEQLARLSSDLYIAEAATSGLAGYERDSMAQVYFKQVLEMHGATMEQYEKDLRLIVNDLPRMEAILQKAQEHLTDKKKTE